MLDLILGILVTWRLTALVYTERGPFDLFGKFRAWVGVYSELDPEQGEVCKGRNEIAKALCCYWCSSVWLAALVTFILQAPALHLFAYSAGAIILWEWVHG